ncbi:hypothetical protein A3C96_00030 [Candidatus Uhrbacteria bacterium RIFCSPHIGHO2_02_FULL_60_10]|uniref:Glutamyl-tRNA amidotransferase n=1 Tax=Candidatus Uhrbacteria bacterium RIFCSPHIGHO2_02_FULL_60_10 TaxID=1802392 RepID=A0A1F7U8D5_9BACT|nr:MAG: hypothetical protein A3C96_00030 [Candidatus Uhrbacteria bacterium RIFCSPHIGHO2_02_FULL_60_10]
MTIRERIDNDFVQAVKARQAAAVSTLRLLKAALKNAEIEKMKPLEEADVISTVSRELKKLKDGLESYVAGQREDLAAQARQEISQLEKYQPQQLSEKELRDLVKQKIVQTGATSVKDFGKVVGLVMKEAAGRIDGGAASAIVKEELARPPG